MGRQQRVERHHTPDLGEGHGESRAQVIESAFGEPTGSGLNCVQGGKEQVATGAGLMPADGQVAVPARHALASIPTRRWSPKDPIDCCAFFVGRRRVPKMEIHWASVAGSQGRNSRSHTHGARFELRGARPGIGRVDGEQIHPHIVLVVKGHEYQSRPEP